MEPLDCEEPITNASKSDTFNQYKASFIALLGALCAGNIIGWTSPALSQMRIADNGTLPANSSLHLTNTECGIVGSTIAIGSLLASIPSGMLLNKYGVKTSINIGIVLVVCHWALIIFATKAYMLYAARLLAGMGISIFCLCFSMYIGEISIPSIRGKLVSFGQVFVCTGILLTYIIGAFTSWKYMSMILAIMPLIYFISFYRLPESPVYLVKVNKLEDAYKSLKYFRGSSYDCQKELDYYLYEFNKQNKSYIDIYKLFTNKANRRALISTSGIMGFQQLCGINVVIFYVTTIFQLADSSLSPSLSTIIFGIFQLLLAYTTSMIIEKLGRRVFLICSSVGMLFCHLFLGLYFQFQEYYSATEIVNMLPIVLILMFIFAYSIGYGPIPWMALSEFFAPEVKPIASGVTTTVNFVFAALITFSFPVLRVSLGTHITFYLYSSFMLLASVFVYFVIPETRGKSFKEIQDILNK